MKTYAIYSVSISQERDAQPVGDGDLLSPDSLSTFMVACAPANEASWDPHAPAVEVKWEKIWTHLQYMHLWYYNVHSNF